MAGGQRVWFGRDAWLTSDPKVQEIGALHGAEGVLCFEEILALAKIAKHQASQELRVSAAVVAQRAFCSKAKALKVIPDLVRVGLFDFESDGGDYFRGSIPRWNRWNDPNAAKRKAESRGNGGEVTDPGRDSGVTVTAMSQRTGTGTGTATEETTTSEPDGSDTTTTKEPGSSLTSQRQQTASKGQTGRASDREETAEIAGLCDLLAELIERNGSKAPTAAQKRNWARDVRLMVERDGRKFEEIEGAIRWCQADSFWRANVLSMGKLRDQFDQMRLQAERKRASGNAGVLAMVRGMQEDAA